MSAYVVDKTHIRYLIHAALHPSLEIFHTDKFRWFHNEWHDISDPSKLGQMLWDENVKSVRYRYGEDRDLPGPVDQNFTYGRHKAFPSSLEVKHIEVIKACNCYSYQSCEHDEWETSEAKAFIDALVIRVLYTLPGYEEAKWGAPESCYRRKKELVV